MNETNPSDQTMQADLARQLQTIRQLSSLQHEALMTAVDESVLQFESHFGN